MRRLLPRSRAAATGVGVAVALALALAAVPVLRGGGGDRPPASAAARLVPADALLYLHLSTEADRDGVRRALALAERFPGFPALRDGLLSRLTAAGGTVDFARDVRPWLGDEAALALLNTKGSVAGSLVLLHVTDRARAQAFLERTGARPAATYRGVRISRYGALDAAFAGDFLAIGQEASVRGALDRAAGAGPSLATDPTYARAAARLPGGRVADAWASRAGVRRLLAPQGGVLGAAGVLLDQPALLGTALALTAERDGARVSVRSVLDRRRRAAAGSPFRPFAPTLADSVPSDALAYLGIAGLDRAAARLLGATVPTGGAAAFLSRLGAALERRSGVDLDRDVLPLFRGEVAIAITPRIPAPVLTIVTRTRDEGATRAALARLRAPLARLFTPRGGRAPVFRRRVVGGAEAFQLTLGPGAEIAYAVFDGRLVISTALDGIRRVKGDGGRLAGSGAYAETLRGRPGRVTSVVFLDFSQLLKLGEQTGLGESRAYLAIRDDLEKVRAVGAFSSGTEADTTAEIFFRIS